MDFEQDFSPNAPIDVLTNIIVNLAKQIASTAHQNNKKYFIGGGLAIDFSVGKITRNHHDIDFHPMLTDYTWWQDWFKQKGYEIEIPADDNYPKTCHVVDKKYENIIDLWPLKPKLPLLLINCNGKYIDSLRVWNEIRQVNFEGTQIVIENPARVLEQKLRHAKSFKNLRPLHILIFDLD